ncbi:haloacid dehalogenase [Pseudomonas syringae pv. theae ICMP 3923]|uniref:HAD hydrolase-like protein n=1 Tax=Pseudomonas syringae TaxID=317 RepID=UPI0003576287|nr:HAD hydrolase-like protein [Pseudomonas syringae]NAT15963.1 haloacid dehalogenase [Pseudomonas syringae pv. actinidifoliorum]EPM68171.1 haloacid dehalogenase [Pseudomonas syringae pv. theae ICMP 3923]MBL3876091.1 HAD family hydrolase [Pseudomonas syringae pv. theae]NAT57816.1 haloacid dehalogenase [Pseudomonas syringae pv. actinidifoliorum]GKQ33403.1 HAD hydrolase-like protein [Pseudomonas syringae pv. theae]
MTDSTIIIFDMDGTVLDSAPGILESLTYAIRQMGHDFIPGADTQKLFGPPMNQIFAELLAPFADDRVDECVQLYRSHYREQGLYKSFPYTGISEALSHFSNRNYSLFIATSKRQEFAEKMLTHNGLFNAFQSIFGTSSDGTLDDKADLVKALLASLAKPPSSVFMIGDKRDDMQAAQLNSIIPVGALWGYGAVDELKNSGALALADTPWALPSAVDGLLPAA